jgi:hypothetical protein
MAVKSRTARRKPTPTPDFEHLAARITAVEMALAKLTAPAPKRCPRGKSPPTK